MEKLFNCGICKEQFAIEHGVYNGYSVEFKDMLICTLCNFELDEEIFNCMDSMDYACPNHCCTCCGCSCDY